jgi:predicted TIM-barrel fold metal-dependent hydrolase
MATESRRRLGPEPTCPLPDPNPTKPHITLPPLSCDSHFQIFGPADKFPYALDRSFTPHDAPKEALVRLHRFLGFERGVFIQSACHGTDNAAVVDALADMKGRYRGVALLDPDTAPAEIARLDAAGFCGVRFHLVPHLNPHLGAMLRLDDLRAVMRLVEPHGWHIAIHLFGKELLESLDFIRSIKAPVVIDHIGRVDAADGPDGRAFKALRGLVDTGKVWVKLSGTDRITRQKPPYRDAVALARILADQAPERMLWGTDWPHPNHSAVPDDGMLVDLIADIAPDDSTRRRMLVDNPAEFFGFG